MCQEIKNYYKTNKENLPEICSVIKKIVHSRSRENTFALSPSCVLSTVLITGEASFLFVN